MNHRIIIGMLLAFSLIWAGCHAQSQKDTTDSVKQKYGNHHFTLDGGHMYYNGKPFMLGDSIQNYAKIFGPHYRKCKWNYVWDSLGITLMVGGGRGREFENERVVEIKWWLVRTIKSTGNPTDSSGSDIYSNSFQYFSVPFHVIPEPLELKMCLDLNVVPGDKLDKLLANTSPMGCGWRQGIMGPINHRTTSYRVDTGFCESIYYVALQVMDLNEGDGIQDEIEFIAVTRDEVRNHKED